MFRVGARVPIVITTRDANGALESDASVQVTIHLAQGTTLGPYPAPTVSVGKQQYDWDTTAIAAGLHSWTATTTTHGNDASDVIDLQPQAPQGLMSLADARAQLNFGSSTVSDSELRGFIDAATAVVERITGPMVPRTVVEQISGSSFLLGQWPVLSVTSIAPYNLTVGGTSYATGDLLVDGIGQVTLASGASFAGSTYTVTYRAGREIIPPAVSEAARIIVQHLWDTQRGASNPNAEDFQPSAFAVPRKAEELLEPYRKAPAIA